MRFFQRVSKVAGGIAVSMIVLAPHIPILAQYEMIPLVSNLPNVAPNTDSNLINPLGMFFVASGNFWVADNGSDLSTLYKPDGTIINSVVGVAGAPTGTVLNSDPSRFLIGSGANIRPSSFLFATESGTILGFNALVDPSNAVIAVDNFASGAVYKGPEIGQVCCGDISLFATDFHNGKIDAFGGDFQLKRSIKDPTIPSGYAPFNVHNINHLPYVTYAKQLPPANMDDDPGPGNGYVDVFTQGGTFIQRLISQGNLNSPWGLTVAPASFGKFAGALPVGNFGDGLINAYDVDTGTFLGQLSDSVGNPIQIPGLWSLEFAPDDTLYFTSGPNGESDGLVGMIVPL